MTGIGLLMVVMGSTISGNMSWTGFDRDTGMPTLKYWRNGIESHWHSSLWVSRLYRLHGNMPIGIWDTFGFSGMILVKSLPEIKHSRMCLKVFIISKLHNSTLMITQHKLAYRVTSTIDFSPSFKSLYLKLLWCNIAMVPNSQLKEI